VPDGDNQTPLHLASYFGRVEMVLVLLNAGANAIAKNAQGRTPLHVVSQCPYHPRGNGVTVAQLLLENGADENAHEKNDGGKANGKIDQRPTPRNLGLLCVESHVEPTAVFWVREHRLPLTPRLPR
jgi:hypothetical protein